MTNAKRHAEDREERAARHPIAAEDAWLRATEETTGQDTLEGAIDVATGAAPRVADDPTVNGYRGHNPSPTDPPEPSSGPGTKIGAHPH